MHSQADLVILGGGCAGLSLAARLAKLGKNAPKVFIIEKRKNYTNDRTWCFWDIENTQYQSLKSHAWSKFEVSNKNLSNEYDCSQHEYLMLESHHFYEDALSSIGSNLNIQLILDQELLSEPIRTEDGWHIKNANLEITTKLIVDTRPPSEIAQKDSILWQSFIGYEIQTQSDLFSPKKMVLMEFDEDFKEGLGFVYILPTTENRALIEYTVFSENRFLKEQLIANLEKSITKKTNGQKYEILRTEHGILPMGYQSAKEEKDSTYLYAGLFSGAARPSSGYAFQRIQSWATSCAESVASHKMLYKFPEDPLLQSLMDGLFLDVIKKNPTMAASLFEDLFKKCDLKTVIKFMSDQATIGDYFRIVRSLPPLPFLRALPHFLFQKIYTRFRSIS